VGGDCTTGSSRACVETAYCDFTSKKCVARLGDGGDCSKSSDVCQTGFYCNTETRKCTTALADGAACTKSETCASKQCVNGKCDANDGLGDFTFALLCGG
jgi:hypothetical protein